MAFFGYRVRSGDFVVVPVGSLVVVTTVTKWLVDTQLLRDAGRDRRVGTGPQLSVSTSFCGVGH